MAIRHAMTFNRQKPVVWNKTYVVNQQCNHNNNMSWVGWTIGGLSIFNTLFSGITGLITSSRAQQAQLAQQQTPQNNLEFENLKKVCKDFKYEVINNGDGTYTAYKQGELPIIGDYKTVLNTLFTLNKKDPVDVDTDSDTDIDTDTDSDMDPDLDGQGGLKTESEYSIEEQRELVKVIKDGGLWHYAHYYADAEGKTDVNAITAALNGQYEVVQENGYTTHLELPKEITVNGKTYSLMPEAERPDMSKQTKSGTEDLLVKYSTAYDGSSFVVFKKTGDTTEKIGEYKTKELAEAAIAEDKLNDAE